MGKNSMGFWHAPWPTGPPVDHAPPIAPVLESGPQCNPIEHDFYVIISLHDIGLSSLTQFSREQSSAWGLDKAQLLTSAAHSV